MGCIKRLKYLTTAKGAGCLLSALAFFSLFAAQDARAGTRLYLRDIISAVNPGPDDERLISVSAGQGAVTFIKDTVAGPVTPPTTPTQFTGFSAGPVLTWYSHPLKAVTISGNLTFNLWAMENNVLANATVTAELLRADNSGNITATIATAVLDRVELTTAFGLQNWTKTPGVTSLVDGDRLALRLYIDDAGGVTMTTSRQVSLSLGGGIGGVSGDSWVEMAETLKFPPVSPAVTSVSQSGAAVNWEQGVSESGYLLQASTAPNFTGTILSSQSAVTNISTLTVSGLMGNTTYSLRIGALWSDGTTTYAPGVTAVTYIEQPTSIYFDEISTWSITASAYAEQITGLERGFSGVAITTDAAYVGWNSPGNTWTSKLNIGTAYNNAAAAAVGGKLYVMGGTPDGVNYSVLTYEYDPAFNTWQTRANMINGRSMLAAAAAGGKIYALGGLNLGGTRDFNEEYDPAANAWYAKAAMPDLRERHAAVALKEKIYVIGGYNSTVKNNVYAYNPATNSWAERQPLSLAKERVAAGVINDRIYIAGGFDVTQINTVEEYNSVTNSWSAKNPMPTSRAGAAAGAIGGKLYVVAGYNGGNLSVNEAYDPATDSWTTKVPAPTQREGMAYGVAKGKLYLVGGNNGPYLQTNEEYNPGVSMYFKRLSPNRYFTFKAKARNQTGVETGEVMVSTYTLAIATMPVGPVFGMVSPESVSVNWSSGSQAGGYNGPNASYDVQASTMPDFSANIRFGNSWEQTMYSFYGLAPKTTYYFRVQAYNSAQVTDYSWTLLGSTRTPSEPMPGAVISTMAWNSQNFNWPRTIVRDSQGNLYTAYLKYYYGKNRVFLSRSTDNGETWFDTTAGPIESAGDVPAANSYDQYWPALAIDSQDVLHLVWGGVNDVLDSGGPDAKCVYSSAAAPGTNWVPYVKIPAHPFEGVEGPFNIAVDSSDGLHIVWNGANAGVAGGKRIRYSSRTADGAWAAYTELNDDGRQADYPALAIDSKDGVHILAKRATSVGSNTTPLISYSSRPIAGAWGGWTDIYNGGGYHQSPPSLTIAADGGIFAAWSSADGTYANSQVKYSRMPPGGSWSAMSYVDLVPAAPQANPTAAADALGNVFVLWSGSDTVNNTVNLKGRVYDGSTWDITENLTNEETDSQIYPSLRWAGWRNNGGSIDVAWNTWDGVSSTATLRMMMGEDVPMSPGWSKTAWPPTPGCGYALNVKQDGSADFTGIQQALNAVPPELSTNTCVVIRDDQTYSEQVTVQDIKTGRWDESTSYRLIIMKDPTFVSTGPVVNPPAGALAAFRLYNDSVTVQGLDIISTNTISYGILASSASMMVSSVNVGGTIGLAGISLSSGSVISYSSISVQNAQGVVLTGGFSTVSQSTITGSSSGGALLSLNGASWNTIAGSYISNLDGTGASLAYSSNFNAIRQSTIISRAASYVALYFYASSTNTVDGSFVSNPAGRGMSFATNANDNTISLSTITASGHALEYSFASRNTLLNSYVQGSTAAVISNSSIPIIRGSVLVSTWTKGMGLSLAYTDGLFMATSTIRGGAQGTAVYLGFGNSDKIELASNTITGGKYGLNIAAMSGGGSLVVSSITFASLSPGATAINFLSGVFITDIDKAAFNSTNIAVNVNGNGLSPTSLVLMPGASGPRYGAGYEYDPMSYIYWDSIAAELVGPADGVIGVSPAAALYVRAPVAISTAQYSYQVDTLPTMDSIGSPQFEFDQFAVQEYPGSGAFSGQDAAMYTAGDAYIHNSTATFVFYSTYTTLGSYMTYYWRARVKTLETGEYGPWTSTASFTVGRIAAGSPDTNNLVVTDVTLSSPTASGVSIAFTLKENNVSTGTTTNGANYNTADWIFVKFSTQAGADGTWNHATLTGGVVDAGATLATVGDNKGVFINHTQNSVYWQAGATVTWNYGADGVTGASARVKVFAISMVKVPQGSFVYNSGGIGGSSYNNYGGGGQATITSANDIPSGAAAGWPNGYNSFYIMRYELTQGLYADFLNSVHSSTAAALYEATVNYGHNMTYNGINPYGWRYGAVDRYAAKNYLSTSDMWSFLSWAALRPMTEMEFEKAARDVGGDTRTYPWGNNEPDPYTYTYSPRNEGGTAMRNFMNFNGTSNNVLDSGRYMSGDVYRSPEQTGASPYGIADLAGNVSEFVLNSAYAGEPLNGTGNVVWPAGWPAPGGAGYGFRGGNWMIIPEETRVSDRSAGGVAATLRGSDLGGRGVRTP
jgi:hypothetical protein